MIYFSIRKLLKVPPKSYELMVLFTPFFFSRFCTGNVKYIYIGRILLVMNVSIFKFAVWVLVEWEVVRGKVILHGNSSLMLKIVVTRDIRLIHKYYPIPR